ncbi:hypothetical protein [Pedobacter steynii]
MSHATVTVIDMDYQHSLLSKNSSRQNCSKILNPIRSSLHPSMNLLSSNPYYAKNQTLMMD